MESSIFERVFRLREAETTVGRELVGGLTTFLTMAYIVVVNPLFLHEAGMPLAGAVTATCLSAAAATFLMAVLARYPIALAPGMGLNAFFTYGICLGAGVPWPTALGLTFWAGILFLFLTVTGARRALVAAVPAGLRYSGAVGIGLFIAFIGFQQGGLVQEDPNTLVSLGSLESKAVWLTLGGFALTLALAARGIKTAIFLGMAVTLGGGLATGIVSTPDAVFAIPSFDLPGFQIDLWGALRWEYLPLVLVMLFFDVFDTLGTLLAVAHEGDLLEDGELPRLNEAMTADSLGSVGGALFGTSTVTSYIESGAGVGVGARTGLASLVTAALFLVAPFMTPLIAIVGAGGEGGVNPVTAPALLAVGILMAGAVRRIDWSDYTEAAPAFLTALTMPLTFNISHGLAVGIIAYAVVKPAAGRGRDVHPLIYVLAALLTLRYALLPT